MIHGFDITTNLNSPGFPDFFLDYYGELIRFIGMNNLKTKVFNTRWVLVFTISSVACNIGLRCFLTNR